MSGAFLAIAMALVLCARLAWAEEVAVYRVDGDGIRDSLTGKLGDAARGRALLVARDPANCVLCHAIPDAAIAASGDVGPSLAGIGARLTPAQLRLRVVDDRRLHPASPMPSYHRVAGLNAVAPAWRGKPILTAVEVEDVVAFLAALR